MGKSLRLSGMLLALAACSTPAWTASADDTYTPIFLNDISEFSPQGRSPSETYPLEGTSSSETLTSTPPVATDTALEPVTGTPANLTPESDLPPVAETLPMETTYPEPPRIEQPPLPPAVTPGRLPVLAPVAADAPPRPQLDDLGLDLSVGLPLELAEFEIVFAPIITVSDAGVRSRWACEKKAELIASADKIAKAPIFEMTKRNFDTWRDNARALNQSMSDALSHCEAGESHSSEINAGLEKAQKAWLALLETRG